MEEVGEGLGVAGGSVAALTLTVAFVFTLTPALAAPPPPLQLPALLVGGSCPLAKEADSVSHPTAAAVVGGFCCVVACFFCRGPSAFEDGDGTRARLAGDLRRAGSGSAVVAAASVLVVVTMGAAVVVVVFATVVVSAHTSASSSALTPFGPLFWR